MPNNSRKTIFTTISIDKETAALVEKICKRYSLKKSEVVKLAFGYIDKAHINPSEAPESVKSELAKINKRQDDIIRFIRHYEEEQLNPMIRATNSIALRFDTIGKTLETLILSQLEASQERQTTVLKKLSEQFGNHADVINNQSKQINALYQIHQRDYKKLLHLIQLDSELSVCGVMDSKRKENLKVEISNLGYDALNVISMNWVVWAGIVAGSLFAYQTFALREWSYRRMTVIAFAAIVGYLMIFYFLIDYRLPKEALMFPLFLRGFGYVIIAICFLTALSYVPFPNFFQSVSVQAFVSAAFGGALGTAILGQVMKVVLKRNALTWSAALDRVNPLTGQMSLGELYGALQQQTLIVTLKELYGWLTLLGILCFLLFMLKESDIRPKYAIYPTYRVIRKLIRLTIQEKD